jgi:hypothetical protein
VTLSNPVPEKDTITEPDHDACVVVSVMLPDAGLAGRTAIRAWIRALSAFAPMVIV